MSSFLIPCRQWLSACTRDPEGVTNAPHEVAMTLEELRRRLSEVDRDLIGLVAARQKIVAEIGAHKIQNSVPTRDYEREREVLKAAHDRANELGLPPELAGEIMGSLIR